MTERLPDDYIQKALQDARRFQGTWDQGTSGSLAAHTYRLITERRQLLATIDELERRNADLRAAVETRLAAAEVPAEIAALHPGVTFQPAAPQPPAEFKPSRLSSSLPDGQLQAAWAAIAAKSRSVREAREPIESVRIDAPEAIAKKPRVVGVAGRAGSGKNAVAAMIPGAAVIQLADPLYAAVAVMLGVPEALLRHRAYKSAPLPGIGKTPRQLLQTLGTEWGRHLVGEDVWIRMAERRIEQFAAAGVTVVAIADVRFENEAEWVRARGGEIWHVYRHGLADDDHASEAGIKVEAADRVIDNSGTLDDLRQAVQAAFCG